MQVCQRHECHTTAGCAHRGPNGELCQFDQQSYRNTPGWLGTEMKRLSDFTDKEIAAEHYRRKIEALR